MCCSHLSGRWTAPRTHLLRPWHLGTNCLGGGGSSPFYPVQGRGKFYNQLALALPLHDGGRHLGRVGAPRRSCGGAAPQPGRSPTLLGAGSYKPTTPAQKRSPNTAIMLPATTLQKRTTKVPPLTGPSNPPSLLSSLLLCFPGLGHPSATRGTRQRVVLPLCWETGPLREGG